MNKKNIYCLIISSIFLFVLSCKTDISGYKQGDCVVDPADNRCKKVCGWSLSYYGRSKLDCSRIKYNCRKGERIFGNWQGCGCARPVF